MYCEKVINEFENPFHMYAHESSTHLIKHVGGGCGDEAYVYLIVEDDLIKEVSFEVFGCASCLALTSFLCRCIENKRSLDLTELNYVYFKREFSELEPSQNHCIDLVCALVENIREVLNST